MEGVSFKEVRKLLEQPTPLAVIGIAGIFVTVSLLTNSFIQGSFLLFYYALTAAYLRLFYKGLIHLLMLDKNGTAEYLTRWKIYHACYYITQLALLITVTVVTISSFKKW